MRVAKEQVDVRMQIPGAIIRQQRGFGSVRGFDAISGEYFTLSAGVDTTPLFVGLDGDQCQCPHWGFVLHGELTTTDGDGVQETVREHDLFYWPPGHNVKVTADAEIVMFSPEHAHTHVINHMIALGVTSRRTAVISLEMNAAKTPPPTHATKQRLLDVGMAMLLEHGYHGLGLQVLLDAAQIPKGSFYHFFEDKEDFALQVIDQYMRGVHAGLDASLSDTSRPPLERVRGFFALVQQSYEKEGYLGCLMGGLGQELSGANPVFRRKIDECFTQIASRTGECLEEARHRGEIASDTDTRRLAALLVDCWEGAALRSRLRGDAAPLTAMLDFFLAAVVAR
jgi:TetR/AcrR family transcriptional regulator, transcriptional repressor for nem operon